MQNLNLVWKITRQQPTNVIQYKSIDQSSFMLIKKKKKMTLNLLSDEEIIKDKLLSKQYLFRKKIGHGCFGKVFQVINLGTRQISALKVETRKNQQSVDQRYSVDIQYNILKRLKNVQGVPKAFQIGNWSKGKFLEMQLLQNDFSVLTSQSAEINKQQLQKIAVKFIKILKQVHDSGIIHRDLKPQNMMENHQGQLQLIDFGISKSYSHTNQSSKKRGFVGTPRYASIAAHLGKQQGPKDDIQSLFYILAHFFFKTLPWMNLPQSPSRIQNIAKIKLEKSDNMFMKIGTNFFKCFRHIRQIEPGQKVNYGLMIQLLSNIKSKTVVMAHRARIQEKKLSLPPNQLINNNQFINLHRERKFSISTMRQVIEVTQATDKTVGTIVINWVNKEELKQYQKHELTQIKQQDKQYSKDAKQNLKTVGTSLNKSRISFDDKGSNIVNKNDNESSCYDYEQCDQNISQNQPTIRVSRRFCISINPFFSNA